jgi:hypothetical protein
VWFKTETVDQSIALRRVIERVDAGELGIEKAELDAAVKALLA